MTVFDITPVTLEKSDFQKYRISGDAASLKQQPEREPIFEPYPPKFSFSFPFIFSNCTVW